MSRTGILVVTLWLAFVGVSRAQNRLAAEQTGLEVKSRASWMCSAISQPFMEQLSAISKAAAEARVAQ